MPWRGRSGFLAALAAGSVAMLLGPQAPTRAAAAETPALQKLIAAAEAEGVLNVEWGGGSLGEAQGAAELTQVMNREFHAHFAIHYTPGPAMTQMATRILQEVKAGQTASTDVFLGPDTTMPALMLAQTLEPVAWSSYFPSITAQEQTKNHEGIVAFILFAGFSYNARLIPATEEPHKITDLFRPEWKGKLATTPYVDGFDVLALAEGDATVRPLVEKVVDWAGGLIRCGEYSRIASGEYLGLVLDCGQITPRYMVENGGPVKFVTLDDALATELIYLSVPKTSAHPNLAKLFAAFIATPDGQAAIAKYGATSPYVPGTPAFEKEKALAARGLKPVTFGADGLAPVLAKDAALLQEYQRIIEKK